MPKEIARLRGVRTACRKSLEGFAEAATDVLRLAALEVSVVALSPLSELERLRLQELQERVTEREPNVAELAGDLENLGLAALNGMLARKAADSTPWTSRKSTILLLGYPSILRSLLIIRSSSNGTFILSWRSNRPMKSGRVIA